MNFGVVVVVILAVTYGTWCFSDQFNQNPQHEFGTMYSKTTGIVVPYWRLGGDAVATEDLIRLTSDRQSQLGDIWNTEPVRFNTWEVVFSVRVHGVGNLGADGMGFWYTEKPGSPQGDFFGFRESFKGLGIIIDTYDNDGTGNHPQLLLLYNDGTKSLNVPEGSQHDTQHIRQVEQSMQLGNCQVRLRNLEKKTFIKVTYWQSTLTVQYDIGSTGKWTDCISVGNQQLPTGYYFGFSAETGQLADNHDIHGIAVRNLDSNAKTVDNVMAYNSQPNLKNLAAILSSMTYEVKLLASGGSSNSGGTGGKDMSSLQSTVKRIEERLGTLESMISGNKQVDAKLERILSQLRGVQNLPDGVSGIFASLQGLFSILWYAFALIIIVGVCYVAYLLYRVFSKKKPRSALY